MTRSNQQSTTTRHTINILSIGLMLRRFTGSYFNLSFQLNSLAIKIEHTLTLGDSRISSRANMHRQPTNTIPLCMNFILIGLKSLASHLKMQLFANDMYQRQLVGFTIVLLNVIFILERTE